MVLLTITPRILSAISCLPLEHLSCFSDPLPTSIDSPIDHQTIIAISHLSRASNLRFTLNELLRGTTIYIPPTPPKPPPSAEYLALKAKLLVEQEQREYNAWLNKHTGVDDSYDDQDDISPSLVLNILLSIVLCAVAVFYVTRIWRNDGLRVLVSLLTGIVVGVAEVAVYAAYLRKVAQARTKERLLKERKQVIGPVLDESIMERTAVNAAVADTEEIWGRGANGGMRRRVRERWEKEQHKDEPRSINRDTVGR